MNSLVFQRNGVVLDGTYVPGVHWFGSAVRLLTAALTCQSPTGGVLRLELEVGGALTGLAFTVGAGSGEARQSLGLSWPVAAGAVLRWRASFNGATDEAATDVAITMSVGAPLAVAPVTGQVVWVDGSVSVPLYTYANGLYAPIAAGQATLTDGETVWIGETLVLDMTYLGLQAAGWWEGGLGVSGPRLEFWLGTERVGVVTPDGVMRVRQLVEGEPSGAGFTFASGPSTVGAVLGSGGVLTALTFIESD